MALTELPISTRAYDISGITSVQRNDVAAVIADTDLTYTIGSPFTVVSGQVIRHAKTCRVRRARMNGRASDCWGNCTPVWTIRYRSVIMSNPERTGSVQNPTSRRMYVAWKSGRNITMGRATLLAFVW